MMDFFILISAYLFRGGVIKEPRYLNLVMKWIWLLSGRIKFSGSRVFSTRCMARLRLAGKNMHLVLDFVVVESICMVRPKHAKCLLRLIALVFLRKWRSYRIHKKRSDKDEWGAFGSSMFSQVSSFASSIVPIRIFWEERELNGLVTYFQGIQESLHNK